LNIENIQRFYTIVRERVLVPIENNLQSIVCTVLLIIDSSILIQLLVVVRYRKKIQEQESEILQLTEDISKIRDASRRQKDKLDTRLREAENELIDLRERYGRSVKDSHKKENLLNEHMNELQENVSIVL
jgi:flagellar motility protein MotE (MotC chaperone)